jgi:hypothetical protein
MACIVGMRDARRNFEVKPEGKQNIGRPWRKWKDIIKICITE